jgi:hypothetical protein
MEVISIKDIVRKDIPLHYREEFVAYAVLHNKLSIENNIKIEFSLERTPFGTKQVDIKFPVVPNFPALSAIKSLKIRILEMEKEGKLR